MNPERQDFPSRRSTARSKRLAAMIAALTVVLSGFSLPAFAAEPAPDAESSAVAGVESDADAGSGAEPAAPEAQQAEPAPEDPVTAADPVAAEEQPQLQPQPQSRPAPQVLAFTPGTVDNGDGTSTYTHADGATVTYPNELVAGEPFTLSGTLWLAKPEMVDEGEEGSVIGFKLIDPTLGQLERTFPLENPRLGDPVTNMTVWGTVWADGEGAFSIELPWPDATNAVSDPAWQAGDAFTLQLLSGTMYSDQPSVDPSLRPDVSRTVALEMPVVAESTEPEAAAPAITANPGDASVVVGESAVFNASASGWPVPTVQWENRAPGGDWTPVPGATQARLTVSGTTLDLSGAQYRAVFTNESGSASTAAATLTVAVPTQPPVFTAQPESLSVLAGSAATFSVAVTGDPEPAIAWQSSTDGGSTWAVIAGAEGSTLSIPNAALDQSGTQYRAVASSTAGTATSNAATLTVEPAEDMPATVTKQPESLSIEAGERAVFTAAAVGAPAPTVQWQRSSDGGTTWHDLRGATSPSYTIEAVIGAHDGQQYRAVFTNAGAPDGVATNAATLTVTPRENVREHCGTSYGPGASNTGIPFCFQGPEKVVVGEPIVIEGTSGYLASDDATGSVVNFFLDAEYSGDPNTVYAKQLFTNPATGATVSDRRTHALVQANADGTWRAEIPWPTVDTVSPTSNGEGSYTAEELAAKFAPGTSHSIRMLTGSLLSNPADRQRGASVYFTVVESLDDEVGVTEPLYEHHTFESETVGDDAVAWVQRQVNSGQTIALTGTGWLRKDGQWGSTVAVRLQDETGAYYERSGDADDPHADPNDPTVWQVVQATEFGDLDARLQMPEGAGGGDFVAVELTTTDDGTALGDVARHWVSEPLVIDNVLYVPTPGEGATCLAAPGQATYELAPGMAVPAANVGGTIRLTGENWCNLVGGGSLIAIKINDGAYSHLPGDTAPMFDAALGEEIGTCPAGACISNKTIWYVIEADEHGSFDVEIPLPDRTNSSPVFGEGAYTLRIMTRTLSADPYYQGARPDPSRTMKSPEFTVVAEGEPIDNVKPGQPSLAPDPLHATNDLTAAARGGVTVDQQTGQWIVTVPGAEPGDWVYANAFDGASPRFPWGSRWFEVDANRRIALPLAGVTVPVGVNKLSVQDRNGDLLGWTTVSVSAPPPAAEPPQRPARSGGGASASVAPQKPTTVPDAPVASARELDETNTGEATGLEQDGSLIVTLPGVEPGRWVHLFLYAADGRVLPIDWVQLGSDRTLTVEVEGLPHGTHKLAFVNAEGELVGWVSVTGDGSGADTRTRITSGENGGNAPRTAGVAPTSGGSDPTMTLVLSGLAVLVLAGSAAGAITLRRRAG